MTSVPITWLQHGQVSLALHRLRQSPVGHSLDDSLDDSADAGGPRTLLMLHGLGERAPTIIPPWCQAWTGPIAALDFTGHGQSTIPRSGGYSAEMLMADADHAIAELGPVTVIGRGLGAYIALLIAGGRPSLVRGAVLCDGPGLAGGAVVPTSPSFVQIPPRARPPDPYALFDLSRDLRPPDYATVFARLAIERAAIDVPITVCAVLRPPWLAAVANELGVGGLGVGESSIDEALAMYQARANGR